MLSCGPGACRTASGASPVKAGVNVGAGGLPPASVQIGAVVHWLFTSPISVSVTADRSSVIAPPTALRDSVPAAQPVPQSCGTRLAEHGRGPLDGGRQRRDPGRLGGAVRRPGRGNHGD